METANPVETMTFASTWGLWLQGPLVLAVLACTYREAGSHLREACRSWVVVAVALAAVAAAVLGLPQSSYHFAGHEGTYGMLLLGEAAPADDLGSYGSMPVPAGLAWLAGRVAPGVAAQQLWLALNRLSALVVVLCIAAVARRWVNGSVRNGTEPGTSSETVAQQAALLAALCSVAAVPLYGWSATGFFVVPGLALGAFSMLLSIAGRPVMALAWAALAVASRMEMAPFVLFGLLMPGIAGWRQALGQSPRSLRGVALGALVVEIALLATKKARLPVDSFTLDRSIVGENLLSIPLGGAWFQWSALALCLTLVLWRRKPVLSGRPGLVWAAAFAAALFQPLSLIDVGARHFLPATVLGLPVLAAAVAPDLPLRRSDGTWRAYWGLGVGSVWARGVALALFILVAGDAVLASQDLRHRYVAGFEGFPEHWVTIADEGRRGSVESLLDASGCYIALPGGEGVWTGASDSGDVREIHNGALALREGQCVRWAVATDVEFSGDASAERLDRAVHTLGLTPVGWLDPPPYGDQPWMVLGAGQADYDPR